MGLYAIPCRQCEKTFMWFSGNIDQRCADCKKLDTIQLPTGDANRDDANCHTILTVANKADPK